MIQQSIYDEKPRTYKLQQTVTKQQPVLLRKALSRNYKAVLKTIVLL